MSFLLIFGSLWRNPLRTIFTFLSISTAFLLFGYLASIDAAFRGGVDAAGADRLVVLHKQSLINLLPESYIHKIKSIPEVVNAGYAVWFGAYYKDQRNSFAQFAVEPRGYLKMYPEINLSEELKEKWYADRTGAIIGKALSDHYGWKIGDRITLTSSLWSDNDFNHDWEFNIIGIMDSSKKGFDSSGMLFHYKYLDETRSWGKGEVGWYVAQVDSSTDTETIAAKIDQLFENSSDETKTSTERAHMQMFLNQVGNFSKIFYLIVGVVLIVILIISGNTMTQSVRERISEFATLSALGFSSFRIIIHVLFESLLMIGLSGFFGLLLAYVLVTYYGDPTGYFLNFYFPYSKIIFGVILIFVVGIITNLSPVYEILKMDKIQALRKVA